MKHTVALPMFFALMALSCDRGGIASRPAGFLQTDSAGISIAESTDSAWVGPERWTIAPAPAAVIGTTAGEDPHTAFGRIGGIEVLSDGRIVVADVLANEIRVFDRDGEYLTTLGRQGQGPAEFGRLDRIARLNGDSVVGRDVAAFKSVVFSSDGSGSRTVMGPPMSWSGLIPVYVAGWLSDGSAIVSHTIQRSDYPPGTSVITPEWHLFDPLGEHRALIGQLPAARVHNEGEGAAPLVFSLPARIQADSLGFWHGLPERTELTHYTAAGVDRIVRTRYEPPLVTEALRESYRAWYTESSRAQAEGLPPSLRDLIEARIDQLYFADRLPAYRRFLLSTDGFFWLEAYPTVEEMSQPAWSWSEGSTGRKWTLLSPQGRWLGTVEIPAGLSLRVVTQDRIVGVLQDELDVQYVAAYEIQKTQQEG